MANIRWAANTFNPCPELMHEMGYRIECSYLRDENGEHTQHWGAEKEGAELSADDPVALLGLVTLWEARGASWQEISDDHYKHYWNKARVFDLDGNEILDS